MTETARNNLKVWKSQLDREFRKESLRAQRAA